MAGISVSRMAACIPLMTRTEQQGASWRLTHARTLPGARRPRRWIRDLADGTALFSERVSALCGGFAMTA